MWAPVACWLFWSVMLTWPDLRENNDAQEFTKKD